MDEQGQVMRAAARTIHHPRAASVVTTHTVDASPRRGDAESFVRNIFVRRFESFSFAGFRRSSG